LSIGTHSRRVAGMLFSHFTIIFPHVFLCNQLAISYKVVCTVAGKLTCLVIIIINNNTQTISNAP